MRTLLPITLLVNLVFSVIELLLGVRLVLRLFGANPNTPFVEFIYDATGPLLAPFAGIFPNPELRGGSVLEIQTLIALLVYGLIAYMVTYLIDYLNARVTDNTTVIEDDDDRPARRRRR